MLALTKQEREVALFIIVVFLAGTAINYIGKQSASMRVVFKFDPSYGKVNINTADKDILKEIPGVGDTLAQRIIDFRAENGRFAQIDDLSKIKGFKGARFERVKDSISVE
ncbi:MAG: helix-hairpin-helix domain-containing protein [Candidatus Omnitrophica bacterium]|jgi:competence ComEA-like helix-hairpin-helix protein|nr:helix-hairpin-helix domain-containing protein [Candidatus Omnitrophota bacterium]